MKAPRTADFDYALHASAIAERPVARGSSRLLVLDAEGAQRHRTVRELPDLLAPGDLLVVNDTRVIRARLRGRRLAAKGAAGGKLELLLVEPTSAGTWRVLLRPARRLRPGAGFELTSRAGDERLRGEVSGRSGALFEVRFERPLEEVLERFGEVPLPPYIRRPADERDASDYQTVFAREPGAIAAPTAGLHFDDALVKALARRGIAIVVVTLHVGPGTFRPVEVEDPSGHTMDSERFAIPAETADAIARTRDRGGRVVAVGTTVVRALETAARPGGTVATGAGRSDLFIRPGHSFCVVDLLLTNFHLPRSTLLMLVAALGGRERVLAAYAEALASGYRFYSYGDAMLLARHSAQTERDHETTS
jgi:S-adenosylmethionine:tRNA ribosyltransferase-isomerase